MSANRFTDEEAVGMLADAARTLADVLASIKKALARVNQDDADAVHAARVEAEFKDVETFGVREEQAALRMHPLQPLWALAAKTGAALERMIALTNPGVYAARKLAELEVKQAFKETKLATP